MAAWIHLFYDSACVEEEEEEAEYEKEEHLPNFSNHKK